MRCVKRQKGGTGANFKSQTTKIRRHFLKNISELMFTFSDKDSSTVCIKSSDYKTKMSELLDDKTTYKQL